MERNLVFHAHLRPAKGPNKRTLSNHVIPRPALQVRIWREGSRTYPLTSFSAIPFPLNEPFEQLTKDYRGLACEIMTGIRPH